MQGPPGHAKIASQQTNRARRKSSLKNHSCYDSRSDTSAANPSRRNARRRVPDTDGIKESDLAEFIHVPAQRINEIIADQESITPSIALRLAKYFGMSADFWMNLQLRWDLYHTQQAEWEDLNAISPARRGLT